MKVEKLPRQLFALFCLLIFGFLSCGDDDSPTGPVNNPPQINSIRPERAKVSIQETIVIVAEVVDAENDLLNYSWTSDGGTFPEGSTAAEVKWQAPLQPGIYMITLTVGDGKDQSTRSKTIEVVSGVTELSIGSTPTIDANPGDSIQIPIIMDNVEPVRGLQMDITADMSKITFGDPEMTERVPDGFNIASNIIEPDTLRIILFPIPDEVIPPGSGPIINIPAVAKEVPVDISFVPDATFASDASEPPLSIPLNLTNVRIE